MLSKHERRMLRGIERQLRRESPDLVRQFDPETLTARGAQRARARMFAAAAALAGLTLLGPRMLNEAEVLAQRSPPLPHSRAVRRSSG